MVNPLVFADHPDTVYPALVKYPFDVTESGRRKSTPSVFVAVWFEPVAPVADPLLNVIV
jgi:hypothetical protein